MFLKLIGALFVVGGCGAVGFRVAAHHRYEERLLRQFLSIIEYMECELSFRLTPLPALCRQAAENRRGALQKFFLRLASELDSQISPDVTSCIAAALNKTENLTPVTSKLIKSLGATLGRFDLHGQLNGFAAIKSETKRCLDELSSSNNMRLRSYQTLGLCAGAALAIIFL